MKEKFRLVETKFVEFYQDLVKRKNTCRRDLIGGSKAFLKYIENSKINRLLSRYALFSLIIGVALALVLGFYFGIWTQQITNPVGQTLLLGDKIKVDISTGDINILGSGGIDFNGHGYIKWVSDGGYMEFGGN